MDRSIEGSAHVFSGHDERAYSTAEAVPAVLGDIQYNEISEYACGELQWEEVG